MELPCLLLFGVVSVERLLNSHAMGCLCSEGGLLVSIQIFFLYNIS